MARVPGTETATNKAGWRPGDLVRCRRSRANGALGLADARGVLVEVRAGHVRVLLDAAGRSVWLESVAVLPVEQLDDPALARLATAFAALRGQRIEFEEGGRVTVFSERFPASAVDTLRSTLGDQLVDYEIEAQGVHEVASRLRLAGPGQPTPRGG